MNYQLFGNLQKYLIRQVKKQKLPRCARVRHDGPVNYA